MRIKTSLLLLAVFMVTGMTAPVLAQGKKKSKKQTEKQEAFQADRFAALRWRNLGPFRGGRAVAAAGVISDPQTYYFGAAGGGIWKTTDAGLNWQNVSDGYIKSSSVGAIAVAPSDPNVVYAGMGEHSIRGVMTSQGDGIYRSTDAGQSWKHMGLDSSRTIAEIRVHPNDPDLLWVAVQGSQWSDSEHRGIYRSTDGGASWEKVFYIDAQTGAADLSMDPGNPRILYAGMWDHRRDPWQIRSGGPGSGLYKSTDGGDSWKAIGKGLPKEMGKVAVDVSPADPMRVYANIEAEGDAGGVYRSENGGNSWTQVSKDRITVARAWYYIEIFADPKDPETVYVLNSPFLKSIDGGKTFKTLPIGHVDEHDLWINPENPANMVVANDGGAAITFNGGKSWSTQSNQPTAQFYRVIADEQFPYHIYGGQQDNTTVCMVSRTIYGGIDQRDWWSVAGGESAFIAFNDPASPRLTYGTSIQGFLDQHDKTTGMSRDIRAHAGLPLGQVPKDQPYRYNWNGPLVHNQVNPQVIYHGAHVLLRSADRGNSWKEISPDLTRNQPEKHEVTGVPFTNEAAGGEVYNTISYIASSPHEEEVIWVGTDDGRVHVTRDEGLNWSEVSPPVLGESLINAIEVSPHQQSKVYVAVNRHKFDDHRPMIFVSRDYGQSWEEMSEGIAEDHFVRVVREDPISEGLLYAGTELGLYVSFNDGKAWHGFQSNLPVTPLTDLTIRDNDLVAATGGRGFWILDDLSALQQSMGKPDTASLQLFAPKSTYRFTLAGGFEKGNVGQNPLPGVIFDYYLPHQAADSAVLKLEVVDGEGKVIRSYACKAPEDFHTWPGGAPPPVILPSKPGLNRMNWDLGREDIPAVEGIFTLGSLRGSKVGPGTYTLRMSLDGEVVEQEAVVLADPRLEAGEEDFRRQQELLSELDRALRDLHLSVTRLRSVKSQLKVRMELLEGQDAPEELLTMGRQTMEKLVAWEEMLIQPRQSTFQDVINFENQLNSKLNFLRSNVDSYDPRISQGLVEQSAELLAQWEGHSSEMSRIIREDLGAFNQLYLEQEHPALIVPK